jgi:hypothetical protein
MASQPDAVGKTPSFEPFMLKMIILPRQARDKHRGKCPKRGVLMLCRQTSTSMPIHCSQI